MADLNSKLTKKGITKMSTTIKQHLKDKGYTKAIKYSIQPIIDEIKLYAVDDDEEISDFVNNWVKLETKFIYAPLFGDKDFN